jgi:hypothetical protein
MAQLPHPAVGIDPAASLLANLLRIVESRARRPLSEAEGDAIITALDEGLSILQSGGAGARMQLLTSNVLLVLPNQGAAWLWASTIEAADRPASSAVMIAAAIVESCSTTAAMLFADAAADFAIGANARTHGAVSNEVCRAYRRIARGAVV